METVNLLPRNKKKKKCNGSNFPGQLSYDTITQEQFSYDSCPGLLSEANMTGIIVPGGHVGVIVLVAHSN